MKVFNRGALIRWRNEHDYTQEDAAFHIGCATNRISDWERGKRDPQLCMLVKISKGTGLPINELVEVR